MRYILLLFWLFSTSITYVAPYGTSSASGTYDDPKSLTSALTTGGTLYLLPGTYSGDYTVTMPETILQSSPGTRAKIDGSITLANTAHDSIVSDIELFDTSWITRTTATTIQQTRALTVGARNVIIKNNYIHDIGTGIAAFNGAGGASANLIVQNNVIYNIGWGSTLGKGSGHGIYAQNDDIGTKLFQNNIFANQYGFNVQIYGSNSPYAKLDHITFDHNTAIHNRVLFGGGQPLKDIQLINNRMWASQLQVGYSNHFNEDVLVSGNWIGNERLQVQWVYTPTVTLNTIVPPSNGNGVYFVPPPINNGIWNNNTYYKSSTFGIDGMGFYNLAQWHTLTNYDTNSVITSTQPLTNWYDVISTQQHHGQVVIYNWTNVPTVTLDLTILNLTNNATYHLVNAQNPSERQAFVAGTPVSLTMQGWTIATPYGANAPLVAWDQRFAIFIVEP